MIKKKVNFYVFKNVCVWFFFTGSPPPAYQSLFAGERIPMDLLEHRSPVSRTPPPACPPLRHSFTVPPWGDAIDLEGPLFLDCLTCGSEDIHHPVRCDQCLQRPFCCQCLWRYLRSPYNFGCPLCRNRGEGPMISTIRKVQQSSNVNWIRTKTCFPLPINPILTARR